MRLKDAKCVFARCGMTLTPVRSWNVLMDRDLIVSLILSWAVDRWNLFLLFGYFSS